MFLVLCPSGSVYASLLQAIGGVMSLVLCPSGSVYVSLLQAVDGVMSLASCPLVVSTPPFSR